MYWSTYTVAFSATFEYPRMATEGISLRLLHGNLNRVEQRLQAVQAQFQELDKHAELLINKFEQHCRILMSQAGENEVWLSLLEDRFTSMEINLFYSYTIETLCFLHNCVVKQVPELASELPSLASILQRKINNKRIRVTWDTVLKKLGLNENNIKALCAFFVAYSHQAHYKPPSERQKYTSNIAAMITKVVKNLLLQEGLLCAVQVMENGKVVPKD
ncbi:single-pass membrane and coiled-coil domain-containing protein 1 isoform X2 [Latimeria chalumnae]|uniref:single-pass membrane and coiled-coil domain-containing protein 1 isoform X2 n=1 Tax=Latimeria chalumnae TaxID=7897 RepID=UPI0006D8DA60|nr:PREDICTED: single-pass membrane and coiled-coil domain-containing protein 1 [Latimeria chalumnae]|eukprot:XP_006014001.2 PREDICTED: single-pass membrane and coiled-coil domain-containing protein 1 [Latimeria chalumnae]